jgi:hypothetical protein
MIFAHRIRCFATHELELAESQAPAHSVHADMTPSSIKHRLQLALKDDGEVERLLRGRVQAINVWRPLKTIRKDPLTVCDYSTINQSDFIDQKMVMKDDWYGVSKMKFNEGHRWCYLDGQKNDEPLVFKQFDSKAEKGGMNVPHSAFVDERFVNFEARESIEIKMWAFFD